MNIHKHSNYNHGFQSKFSSCRVTQPSRDNKIKWIPIQILPGNDDFRKVYIYLCFHNFLTLNVSVAFVINSSASLVSAAASSNVFSIFSLTDLIVSVFSCSSVIADFTFSRSSSADEERVSASWAFS